MKLLLTLRATVLFMVCSAAVAETMPIEQRAFAIELAIRQGDLAIGFPNGRPESLELLRVDYVVKSLKGNRFEGILLPDDVVKRLKGKTFWVLHYRAYPISFGGGYSVILDGLTGERIYVSRSK
jgi:hypothetical protein